MESDDAHAQQAKTGPSLDDDALEFSASKEAAAEGEYGDNSINNDIDENGNDDFQNVGEGADSQEGRVFEVDGVEASPANVPGSVPDLKLSPVRELDGAVTAPADISRDGAVVSTPFPLVSPIVPPVSDGSRRASMDFGIDAGMTTPRNLVRGTSALSASGSMVLDDSFAWGDEGGANGGDGAPEDESTNVDEFVGGGDTSQNVIIRPASPLISDAAVPASSAPAAAEDSAHVIRRLGSNVSIDSIDVRMIADAERIVEGIAENDEAELTPSDESLSSEEETAPLTVDEAVERTVTGPVGNYIRRHFSGEGGAESVVSRTGIAYDNRMLGHRDPHKYHPECPERVLSIMEAVNKMGLGNRMRKVEGRETTMEEVMHGHTQQHFQNVKKLSDEGVREQMSYFLSSQSVYTNEHSVEASLVSCGATVQLVEDVCSGKLKNGLAVVRPPGHHATCSCMMGFCLFNNVAVATIKAKKRYGVRRVLIVDWDVHHGNGTQEIVQDDPDIMYFSAHRYEHGQFYPGGTLGSPKSIGGGGAGRGTCINIGWNGSGPFGDPEYLAAWDTVLMPAARAFMPDLVLISAGFDAAIGDPLGACHLTPFGYGHLLHSLMSLAEGRCVVALEGGYNLQRLAEGASVCAAVLLGAPPPALHPSQVYIFEAGDYRDIDDEAAAMAPAKRIERKIDSPIPPYISYSDEFRVPPGMFYSTPSFDAIAAIRATVQAHSDAFRNEANPAPIASWTVGAGAKLSEFDLFSRGRSSFPAHFDDNAESSSSGEDDGSSGDDDDDNRINSLKRPSSAIMDETEDSNVAETRRRLDSHGAAASSSAAAPGQTFVAVPLQSSRHLNSNHLADFSTESESAKVFAARFQHTRNCFKCGSTKDLWMCLKCLKTFSSLNGHAREHSEISGHKLALAYSDLSVWDHGHGAHLDAKAIPELRALYTLAHSIKYSASPQFQGEGVRESSAAPMVEVVYAHEI